MRKDLQTREKNPRHCTNKGYFVCLHTLSYNNYSKCKKKPSQ